MMKGKVFSLLNFRATQRPARTWFFELVTFNVDGRSRHLIGFGVNNWGFWLNLAFFEVYG